MYQITSALAAGWTRFLVSGASLTIMVLPTGSAWAQQASEASTESVVVTGLAETSAAQANYQAGNVDIGPLGNRLIADTPQSVTMVPEALIANQQAQTVNDTLRYLPSVEVRDQQGLEVSRPQSRGFQGTIVQNTRIDGLNAIGTTAMAAENLSGIEVLNGLAGSLYGPETPAGVFNYMLKRPTDKPLYQFTEGFDSNSVFTEAGDIGGRIGPDDMIGYRINAVHGEGESYAAGSSVDRNLLSAAFDFHIDDATVVQADYSYYETDITGLPGSIVYDGSSTGSGKSTLLPAAIDPTRPGYGQPGAGADLRTNLGVVKILHSFGDGWNLELGGLYEDAIRNLTGITNTLQDNEGNYTVTKNFTAVPHFTIGSYMAYLNGQFDWLGTHNEVTLGTNGFVNGQYTFVNSAQIPVKLGTGNLANPSVLPANPQLPFGPQYQSGQLSNQSLIVGDTIHFNAQWAIQGVVSESFLDSRTFNAKGQVTQQDSHDGVFSPTVSLIYKPIPALTTYISYANSVEQGEQAAANNTNANAFLAPYHDRQYEVGLKYAVTDGLLITLDGFEMTRPLANTDPTNGIFEVVGTQRNWGSELFAQGDLFDALSVFGGVTYIDARLVNSDIPADSEKLVVGVPNWKSDLTLDYHPVFAGGLALTAALHGESKRAATDTNNSFAPSCGTIDLGARYALGYDRHIATLRFQVLNLTDTRYFSSIADGNIVGSPGANTAYSGAPRTYEVSLQLNY